MAMMDTTFQCVMRNPFDYYSIELYFDSALENQFLKAWNILARRLISDRLIDIGARPHITLLSAEYMGKSKVENVLRNLAPKQEPISLCFSSIGTISKNKDVLFLRPTPSMSLLQFHSQLCDAIKKEGIEIEEKYLPDKWVPYCSVAIEVERARSAEAFTLLRDLKMPVSGYAVEISFVEYTPVREILSFPLGAPAG